MTQPATTTDKAGFSIGEWCPAAGISRATYYALPDEAKPAHVYIGARPVITEAPAAWLARARQGGGVTIPKRKTKPAPEKQAAPGEAITPSA